MIAIINVSPDSTSPTGINQYELRINSEVICEFNHHRKYYGLAQCLRDAANAVELEEDKKLEAILDRCREWISHVDINNHISVTNDSGDKFEE